MQYFVIYDLKDNIIAYIDNIKDLLLFTGVRKNNLVNGLKKNNVYWYKCGNTYNKIYSFFERF